MNERKNKWMHCCCTLTEERGGKCLQQMQIAFLSSLGETMKGFHTEPGQYDAIIKKKFKI